MRTILELELERELALMTARTEPVCSSCLAL